MQPNQQRAELDRSQYNLKPRQHPSPQSNLPTLRSNGRFGRDQQGGRTGQGVKTPLGLAVRQPWLKTQQKTSTGLGGVTWADQAGSGSRPAGSRDEWVGSEAQTERAQARTRQPETETACQGKGERARRASPNAYSQEAKRHKSGETKPTASWAQRAWSHQPVRTWAMAPAAKKRPHSDPSPRASSLTSGCNNLRGVTVERVEGQLRAYGPQEKVALLDAIGLRLLEAGDRRGAQDHLRNNRRAIRNRYQELLAGGQGNPEQLRRFAEAKARKMPWDDKRNTRFIVDGEDPAMAAAEPVVHVEVGPGVPALLSTHPSQYRSPQGLDSNQLQAAKEEEHSPPGLVDEQNSVPQEPDQASVLDL
eukprot:6325816-Amphidinium_carterae.2